MGNYKKINEVNLAQIQQRRVPLLHEPRPRPSQRKQRWRRFRVPRRDLPADRQRRHPRAGPHQRIPRYLRGRPPRHGRRGGREPYLAGDRANGFARYQPRQSRHLYHHPASHGPVPSRWRPSVTQASIYTRSSNPITASPASPWRRRPPR